MVNGGFPSFGGKKLSSSSVAVSCVTWESVTRVGVNNGIACKWRHQISNRVFEFEDKGKTSDESQRKGNNGVNVLDVPKIINTFIITPPLISFPVP